MINFPAKEETPLSQEKSAQLYMKFAQIAAEFLDTCQKNGLIPEDRTILFKITVVPKAVNHTPSSDEWGQIRSAAGDLGQKIITTLQARANRPTEEKEMALPGSKNQKIRIGSINRRLRSSGLPWRLVLIPQRGGPRLVALAKKNT